MKDGVKVKIKLKKRHPRGFMWHGRHQISMKEKECMMNAQELEDLRGVGPQAWFQFEVNEKLTKKDKEELKELKKQKELEAQKEKEAEEKPPVETTAPAGRRIRRRPGA